VYEGGVNFSVFSKNAEAVSILLFDSVDDARPAEIIPLDPRVNRTYYYWHAFVSGLKPGQIYGFRVDGPFDPDNGLRFDPKKVLLDPYARRVLVPNGYSRLAARMPGDNTAWAMKSVVTDLSGYRWEGDVRLKKPFAETVIYEMHVAGFTRHPSSGVASPKRGTYAGVIEKIPYLTDLGITAVELLPVFQFDEQDSPPGLVNYWGYCPVSFFAPHQGYSSRSDIMGPLDEFRDMVKAFHRAGIEVILDVVYNHTAEGNEWGPTLCFKGLENRAYYILNDGRSGYADFTGTGSTLNANHSVVRRLIGDSLRFWAQEMHVDGFRFDLASILSRDESGVPLANPPVIWEIESDPALAGTKLIAEAWDPGGLYQVGSFVGDTWKEWNGKFRDDIRSFLKGDDGAVLKLAYRMMGSPDIYAHKEREPEHSVNFVTCHDGFTLNDLVSYDRKHNLGNREDNRDGTDHNLSWNCGAEGPTSDPAIETLRNRQVKNFLALTLVSLGTPMLLMGDEVRRTQNGNNNAYCQDNELSWFDWTLLDKHGDIHRFVKQLIYFRLHRGASEEDYDMTLTEVLQKANIQWHGVKLDQPDWSDSSHSLAFTVMRLSGEFIFHFMLNAYWKELNFELPPLIEGFEPGWRRWLDTSLESPDDRCDDHAPAVGNKSYPVQPRSVAVLFAKSGTNIPDGDG